MISTAKQSYLFANDDLQEGIKYFVKLK